MISPKKIYVLIYDVSHKRNIYLKFFFSSPFSLYEGGMKANVLNQERASLLNILTRSDTLRPSPGLEMTASISRLADERKVQIISC